MKITTLQYYKAIANITRQANITELLGIRSKRLSLKHGIEVLPPQVVFRVFSANNT